MTRSSHQPSSIKNDFGIEVGTPCCFSCWTDIYPGVVVRVTKRLIFIKRVRHGVNKLQWPEQDYDIYLDQPISNEIRVHKTKHGFTGAGYSVSFGTARAYTDPHF